MDSVSDSRNELREIILGGDKSKKRVYGPPGAPPAPPVPPGTAVLTTRPPAIVTDDALPPLPPQPGSTANFL